MAGSWRSRGGACHGDDSARNRIGWFEERMVRLEGTLDVLREFFVGSRHGTAACNGDPKELNMIQLSTLTGGNFQ